MSRTTAALQAVPRRAGIDRVSLPPDTRVIAFTPEVAAAVQRRGIPAESPAALREDHAIHPADERAKRWATEFMQTLHTMGAAAPMHRGVDTELMLEGRLKFYFFRRLALFYTRLEALLRTEHPDRLILCANDRLFIRLARDLAARGGIVVDSIPAQHGGLSEREAVRRRHTLRYAAIAAHELAAALRPRSPRHPERGDGMIAVFAESYRQLEMTEPVLRALDRRGRFSVIVVHRPGSLARLPGLRAQYAPLDRYLTPAGFLSLLRAVLECNRLLPSGRRMAAAAEGYEWRGVAAAARREILFGAFPFVVTLIERIRSLKAAHDPDVGITLTEMGGFGQTIARAGRRFGMATLNMEHGIKTHLPMVEAVITDRIAAFGEKTAEVLVQQGADPASIVVTGAPRHDALFRREGILPRDALLGRLGLDPMRRLIVFASYPLDISPTHSARHKSELIDALCRAVTARSDTSLAVKLHLLEHDRIAADLLAGKPRDRFRVADDSEAPLDSLLSACDVLATFTSTTALEASILGKPVLITNLSGLPDSTPYVSEGIALYATSPEELSPALARLLDDPATRETLAAARRRFIRRFAGRDDGRASERVANLIVEMVLERRSGRGR